MVLHAMVLVQTSHQARTTHQAASGAVLGANTVFDHNSICKVGAVTIPLIGEDEDSGK